MTSPLSDLGGVVRRALGHLLGLMLDLLFGPAEHVTFRSTTGELIEL